MTSGSSIETALKTPLGGVCLRSFSSPDEIRRHSFDEQFGITEDYKSLYSRRESLEKMAEQADANVVLALDKEDHIIAYAVLANPDPQERWTDLRPGLIMEVKAIEVGRAWRSAGIASQMTKLMLDHPRVEAMIVYLVGYSWTWDLKGTHKSPAAYRQMLINIFKPFGFKPYETNEPNVCLKPENILMARIGSNVSHAIADRFKWLRYDLNQWSWSVG